MLKGIDPVLGPELLHILRAMGHGDELAIVDANFPAAASAKRLVRLDGVEAPRVLKAVLSLMALDDFVDVPMTFVAVVDDPTALPEITREFHKIAEEAEGRLVAVERTERCTFYERAKQAYAVVATGERRLYGCVIVKKGVIRPESAEGFPDLERSRAGKTTGSTRT